MDTSKIARYVWKGQHDKQWYLEAERLFIDLFGAHRLDLVTKLFAATSINTSLKSNVTLFRRALHEIENDLPFSNYLPNIRQQLEQIRAGKDLTGRKINSFSKAMSGNKDAVVVDVWLLRAFDMDRKYFRNGVKLAGTVEKDTRKHTLYMFSTQEVATVAQVERDGRFRSGGASDGQYTKIEKYVRDEAKAMGIEARQLSAMIWSGVRIDQSGDYNTRYSELLQQKFRSTLFN